MIRLLIWGLLLFLAYKVLTGIYRYFTADRDEPGAITMVQDPQCGVYLPANKAVRKKRGEETLHFCSRKCAKEYLSSRH